MTVRNNFYHPNMPNFFFPKLLQTGISIIELCKNTIEKSHTQVNSWIKPKMYFNEQKLDKQP